MPTARKRTKKPPAPKRVAKKKTATISRATRPDFGAPIDGFFAKQPPHLRAILVELRKLVEDVAPEATSSIKWGMPFYTVGKTMMCALGAHKAHVNLILAGPPNAFADPEGRLEGESKLGKHLKLTSVENLPKDAIRRWLRTALDLARKKSS